MDRYDIQTYGDPTYMTYEVHPGGAWVKYSDVESLLARVRELEGVLSDYEAKYNSGGVYTLEECAASMMLAIIKLRVSQKSLKGNRSESINCSNCSYEIQTGQTYMGVGKDGKTPLCHACYTLIERYKGPHDER